VVRVWIDGTTADDAQPLFGLAPLERHLRALRRLRPAPDRIVVSGSIGPPQVLGLDVWWEPAAGPAGARLAAFIRSAPTSPVLALDGGATVDPRLFGYLMRCGGSAAAVAGEGKERATILRLDGFTDIPVDCMTLLDVADRLLRERRVLKVTTRDVPSFVANLRRDLPFWLFAAPDSATRERRERFLFWSNYKGSTDFLTRWIYPPLVWPLVRLACRWRLHPNWVTLASAVLAFAAVPLFAAGWFWAGLLAAYTMSVLDSVDGKVARLTLTDSALGNVLDHGLDIVHPPLWYLAWAWGLGGRSMDDPVLQAGLLLTAFYITDRLVLAVPKAVFKRGLHSLTRLDARIRAIIARRNVNMAIFTVGLAFGLANEAFYVIVAWQGATLAWHAIRTVQLISRRTELRHAA
jgi:phosphatidylglycerophosphate synthase